MSNFQRHSSPRLNELYHLKSYQGANPRDADILFVGKDPNWAVDIENSEFIDHVSEYLRDGVEFWKKYGYHHPFRNPAYNGNGTKYHSAVARINLPVELAHQISFVELIGFPTTGMSSTQPNEFYKYLLSEENRNHLIELDELVSNPNKLVFFFWGMINFLEVLHQKTGLFKSLANIDKSKMIRTDLNKVGNIYFHKHFSMGISQDTLNKIHVEVTDFLNTGNSNHR